MKKLSLLGISLLITAAIFAAPQASSPNSSSAAKAIVTIAGMPALVNPQNLYSETAANMINPALKDDLQRVYVPNLRSNSVTVIDPVTMKVVDKFKVGFSPQHIIPSWDLRTLWVANNAERHADRPAYR